MKLRTLLFTAILGLGALAPVTSANAGHTSCERTRVTYDDCGRPVYWVYRVVGYCHDGCPRYAWVRTAPPCDRESYGGGYSGGYGHSHGYSRHSDSSYRGSRGGFSFRFGR